MVATTKRETQADWGAVNMLYESKTLAGSDEQLDVPEERIDAESGFEYLKIFSLFKVLAPNHSLLFLYLKPIFCFLIFSLVYRLFRASCG